MIGAILKDEPPSITELNPSLPRHAGRIIRRCLAKEPDRRYETALGLRNELDDLKSEIDSGDRRDVPAPHAAKARQWVFPGIVAVIAIAAVFTVMQWKKSDSPPTQYTRQPLTSSIGREGELNWSPESEFIAFAQARDGSLDVMVQPVAGEQAAVRAGGPGDQRAPRWSPDGRYLAYFSTYEPGTFVYLRPPHGGTPRRLIATNLPTLSSGRISGAMGDHPWSRDSTTLLVSRVGESGQTAVYRVDRETGDSERLTDPPAGNGDRSASYSFDGERIVFERRANSKGTLLIMPSAGGDPDLLLADGFDNSAPAWRPDNRHVVFLSNRGGSANNLWEIDTSSGAVSPLIADTNELSAFSISADNRMAYVPFWHDTFLFVVDVTTRERRQLTSHGQDNFGARFSPGGRTVAYHSTRTGNSEIWLYHLDGRPEIRVTEDRNWDLYPDWSPDGDQLIFVSDRRQDGFRIFIANSDGGGERLLVDRPIAVSSTGTVNTELVSRWSPEGDRIAFLVAGKGVNTLWTIQPDGEGARELLENVTGFDWYRDSRRAIYTRPRGSESEVIAVDLETGQEQALFVGSLMEIDVAPDGSAVAFSFGRGHQGMGLAVLKLEPPPAPGGLPRALGEPEFVVPVEGTWHVHNGGWSADSKQLVYTQDQDYGDIYELVEKR
jgi:Tol biopolymer transport system component